MDRYSRKHLTDGALLTGFRANVANERGSLAEVLADIGEVEERKLFVPAGYESMYEYCTRELHFSKDAAYKRVHAARTALAFPAIFERVAAGALGLRVVNLLAPCLTPETVGELLAAASFRTREEVRELLAERFPQEPVSTTIEPIAQPLTLAPTAQLGEDGEQVPGPVQGVVNPPQIQPLATDLYKLQLTMNGAMYTKLRRALELFGRRKPVPDEAEIIELGLDLLVARLEKKKFAATDRPRAARRSESVRHISNEVKRAVMERDGGQCTFQSDNGTRCPARMDLEWEHIVPVAKGGTSEAGNIKLLCRAHNQYEAERVYGKAFMRNKREQAMLAAEQRRAEKEAEREKARVATASLRAAREAERATKAAEKAAATAKREAQKSAEEALDSDEAMPWLRGLGFTIAEARGALTKCGPTPELRIEARIKRCLSLMPIRGRRFAANGAALS